MTPLNQLHLGDAIAFAAEKHRGQLYGSTQPYILHPLRVMHRAQWAGFPLLSQIAAVLHDTIEDTSATYGEILSRFGFEVAELVKTLTRGDEETYKAYIQRVNHHAMARRLKRLDIEDHLQNGAPDSLVKRYAEALGILETTNHD